MAAPSPASRIKHGEKKAEESPQGFVTDQIDFWRFSSKTSRRLDGASTFQTKERG